jgi:YidC/Oxa1 family membrane protein insertase
MDILYYIFIYPLEFLMRACLAAAFQLTRDYGLAIICLSLIVSIALLPFYHLGERWKEAERSIRRRMEPELSSIKKHYEGQERFLLTQAVYRRFAYKPIYSLRVSFSFLIQVPFFFAAYHLLSNYGAYEGISFLFIHDLGRPDGLLHLNGETVNLLPFVMTAVNLASAVVYTKYMSRSDKLQLWGLSGLFLVVLYDSPAGLLLYWTMNNVFSFIKNLLEVNLDLPYLSSRREPGCAEEKRSFDWQKARRFARPVAFCLLALTVYMAFVSWVIRSAHDLDPNETAGKAAAYLAIAASIALCVLLVQVFVRDRPKILLRKLCFGMSLLLAIAILAFLHISNTGGELYEASAAYLRTRNLFLLFLGLAISLFFFFPKEDMTSRRHHPAPVYVPILAVFQISCLIFIYQPIVIYATSPDTLTLGAVEILVGNLVYAAGVFLGLCAVVLMLRRFFRLADATVVFSALALTLFSLLPADYGALSEFWLSESVKLYKSLPAYVAEFLALLLLLILTITLMRKFRSIASYTLVVVALTSFGEFAFALNTYSRSSETAEAVVFDDGLPQPFVFSKTNKNIVVFMLDSFTGGLVEPLLEENPRLVEMYQGFVWYPNTLSVADITAGSIAALNAGFDYAPEAINTQDRDNLLSGIIESYDWLFDVLARKDYQSHIIDPTLYHSYDGDCSKLAAKGIGCSGKQKYSWRGQSPGEVESVDNILLAMVSLFKSLPFAIKPIIYDRGNWIIAEQIKDWGKIAHSHASQHWGFFVALLHNSRVEDVGNTFKYFQNALTHTPYLIGERCVVDDNNFVLLEENEGAYFSAKCALTAIADWLQWARANGIYDNTKVILISDHGNGGISNPMFVTDSSDSENAEGSDVPRYAISASHALLMVKDFESGGVLTLDHRLMSNADMPAIICGGLVGCDGVRPDPTIQDPVPERLLTFVETDSWRFHTIQTEDRFPITKAYQVKQNIFDPANWERTR